MGKFGKAKTAARNTRIAKLLLKGATEREIQADLGIQKQTFCIWMRKYDEEIAKGIKTTYMIMTKALENKGAQRFYQYFQANPDSMEVLGHQAELALRAAMRIVPQMQTRYQVTAAHIDITHHIQENNNKFLDVLNKMIPVQIIETNGNSDDTT